MSRRRLTPRAFDYPLRIVWTSLRLRGFVPFFFTCGLRSSLDVNYRSHLHNSPLFPRLFRSMSHVWQMFPFPFFVCLSCYPIFCTNVLLCFPLMRMVFSNLYFLVQKKAFISSYEFINRLTWLWVKKFFLIIVYTYLIHT